jgi:hypothetical protein
MGSLRDFPEKDWPTDENGKHEHYDMCNCPDCGAKEMMQPVYWERGDKRTNWKVILYCGECLTRYKGVFDEQQIDDFDDILDANLSLLKTLSSDVEAIQMNDFMNNFVTALNAGHILPEDF